MPARVPRRSFLGAAGTATLAASPARAVGTEPPRATPPRLLYPDGRSRFSRHFYAFYAFYALGKRGDLGVGPLYPARFTMFDGREAALPDTAHLHYRPS
jgi:hypothetical protein